VAKNFGDIQTSVYSWLGKENPPGTPDTNAIPLATVKDLINKSQDDICEECDWTWTETNQPVTILAGQTSIAFPQSLLRLFQVRYTLPDGGVVILRPFTDPAGMLEAYHASDEDDDESLQPISDPDYPLAFNPWGHNLNIECPAITDLTFNVYGNFRLPELSADADTNFIVGAHWFLLLMRVLAKSSLFGFEDERVPIWAATYQEELGKLKSLDASLRNSATYLDTSEPG